MSETTFPKSDELCPDALDKKAKAGNLGKSEVAFLGSEL